MADVPPQPVFVDADRSGTQSVIRNLLDNAIKYSPNGGEIRCTVRPEGRHVVIEVSDHGFGIAAEHMDRLSTRFGRLPTEDNVTIPGTGLGLYLCREIALRHGGDLVVSSTPGQGSTFTLTLPACA